MEGADPEQRLPLAPNVAELPVQPYRTLEEFELPCVLDPLLQEPGVDDLAAGQGEIRLDRVESLLGSRQRAAVPSENRTLVEELGLFDSCVPSHAAIVRKPSRTLPTTFQPPTLRVRFSRYSFRFSGLRSVRRRSGTVPRAAGA